MLLSLQVSGDKDPELEVSDHSESVCEAIVQAMLLQQRLEFSKEHLPFLKTSLQKEQVVWYDQSSLAALCPDRDLRSCLGAGKSGKSWL